MVYLIERVEVDGGVAADIGSEEEEGIRSSFASVWTYRTVVATFVGRANFLNWSIVTTLPSMHIE